VAGKTGTAVAEPKQTQNSTVWFVGMTPSLVAATELVDLDSPFAPSRGLPGEATGAAYGDYASGVWLKALGPVLDKRSWTWPDPDAVAGAEVPDLTGQSLTDAAATLKNAGYKMAEFNKGALSGCPSGTVPSGQVAYYAPQIAPAGATITVCPSSGVTQPVAVIKPPKPPPSPGHGHGHGNQNPANGNGNSGDSGTGGSGGGPNGGPGGTTSPAPGPGHGNGNGGGHRPRGH
jgi:membrane peptidoglycan carboxypeptidase